MIQDPKGQNFRVYLSSRIIQADTVSAHGGNILMRRVESSQPVTQTTNERIQCLVGYTYRLIFAPNHGNQVWAAYNLSLVFVQYP